MFEHACFSMDNCDKNRLEHKFYTYAHKTNYSGGELMSGELLPGESSSVEFLPCTCGWWLC